MEPQLTSPQDSLRRAAGASIRATSGLYDDAVTRWVGGKLLDAKDERALSDLVEEIAEDRQFWSLVEQRSSAGGESPAPPRGAHGAMWRISARLTTIFGSQPSFLKGLIELLFLDQISPSAPRRESVGPDDPLWFAYDPAIPPVVGRALVQNVYALIAVHGILFVAQDDVSPPPWWSRAMVDLWSAAQHEYLRLVASLPGVNVSLDLVPASERFDLAAQMNRNAALNDALAGMFAQARRSGEAVFTPFPEPDRATG